MTEQEVIENKPEGATHYIQFTDEMWYLKWSNLLSQYVVKHNDMWVTFSTAKMKDIKTL